MRYLPGCCAGGLLALRRLLPATAGRRRRLRMERAREGVVLAVPRAARPLADGEDVDAAVVARLVEREEPDDGPAIRVEAGDMGTAVFEDPAAHREGAVRSRIAGSQEVQLRFLLV